VQRYQDAIRAGGIDPGERDCAPRWELVEPHVPEAGILVDIGSNLGYYGLRAVEARPSLAVVSIEADPEIAARQAALLAEHETERICLLQGTFNGTVAEQWAATCDWVQTTLLFSVLHWLDDPAAVVRSMSAMSQVLIAEVPDAADHGACGQDRLQLWADPLDWFRRQTGRDVTLLGRMPRHTSEVPSHVVMVSGPIRRIAAVPYWGFAYERSSGERRYAIGFDGERTRLEVGDRDLAYRPGINLVTLMHLGRLVHPSPRHWIAAADRAIADAPGHGDPYPHNMLWAAGGLSLIDEDDLAVETPAPSARVSIRKNVAAWAANRTSSRFAYVPERPGPWRRLRRIVGRALRGSIGDVAVDRMKSRVGLFGASGRERGR
jgi:hypothetical protein